MRDVFKSKIHRYWLEATQDTPYYDPQGSFASSLDHYHFDGYADGEPFLLSYFDIIHRDYGSDSLSLVRRQCEKGIPNQDKVVYKFAIDECVKMEIDKIVVMNFFPSCFDAFSFEMLDDTTLMRLLGVSMPVPG